MKEDSLKVNVLNDLGYAFRDINANEHLKYCTQALKLSKNLNYLYGNIEAHRNIGVYYLGVDNKKSNEYFEYVLKNTKNKSQIAKAYLGKGFINSREGNFPKALDYYFKGLKFAEEGKDYQIQGKILTNIGTIYQNSGDYEKAISHFKKAIEFNDKHKNLAEVYMELHNVSSCYSSLKQYDKALKHAQEAEKVSDKLGILKFKNTTNDLKAGIYVDQEKYEQALEIYKKSLKNYLLIGDENMIIQNYNLIAETYTNLAESNGQSENQKKEYLQEALFAIEKAIILTKKAKNIRRLYESYRTLSYIQKTQGNFEVALETQDLSYKFKDSVFNSDNKETIKNLEDKREIELRDKEIKINKLSLDAKEKQKWYLLGGLGLLTVIGGLLFYQSRKRKQNNNKLQILNENLDSKNLELDQANKAKTRFFSILNHDLRGPVNNLIFFLQLQNEAPELLTEENTKRMQDKTMSGAKNLLSSMEDILQWSKSQMENFKPQPKNLLVNQLFEDTEKVFSGYLKITFEYQNPDNIEIFTDENYLKTIIRNLTSNAINSFTTTENPTITWKAWQIENQRFLFVTDNGLGASKEKFQVLFDESEFTGTKSGLGLYLIRDMAKAINCEISVDSTENIGTTFTLKF
ncbi:tetratricopeptide repeat protein [Flavobacterium sp.]|uniref:tetratricopeptide repeat-containing sensor histidine kinase n=1 Tax=Flavobacterium sp. TaxID=239 RepID=UPI003751269E